MLTVSGVQINREHVGDRCPTSLDISIQWGRQCLFGGAIWYPALCHAAHVAVISRHLGASDATIAWALLHDAHEVITGDVLRDFKPDVLRRTQNQIDQAIWRYYGLHQYNVQRKLIKHADDRAITEAAVLCRLPGYDRVYANKHNMYPSTTAQERRWFNGVYDLFGSHDTVRGFDSPGVVGMYSVLEMLRLVGPADAVNQLFRLIERRLP